MTPLATTTTTTQPTHLVITNVHVQPIGLWGRALVVCLLCLQELQPLLDVALPGGVVGVGRPRLLDALHDALQLQVAGSPGLQLVVDVPLLFLWIDRLID